jgi:hypothetical protein
MSLGILARTALNLNFKNGATLSVLLNVQRVAVNHDPEHLASLQTLMVIHNKGGNTWKDWVTNLLHPPDRKDRSIKTADVTKSILQTKTFGPTAQVSSGEECLGNVTQFGYIRSASELGSYRIDIITHNLLS